MKLVNNKGECIVEFADVDLPLTLTMETYIFEKKQYEIKPSYLRDEHNHKDKTKIRGLVMIGK